MLKPPWKQAQSAHRNARHHSARYYPVPAWISVHYDLALSPAIICPFANNRNYLFPAISASFGLAFTGSSYLISVVGQGPLVSRGGAFSPAIVTRAAPTSDTSAHLASCDRPTITLNGLSLHLHCAPTCIIIFSNMAYPASILLSPCPSGIPTYHTGALSRCTAGLFLGTRYAHCIL